MLYRCNSYKECKLEYHCDHYEPHKYYCFDCCSDEDECTCHGSDTCLNMGSCTQSHILVKCIPIFDDFITKEDMEI